MPLISGAVLEGYEIIGKDLVSLRESLLQEADRMGSQEKPPFSGTGGAVPVDHYYNVKGVGIVVLGCVAQGVIRKHDTLTVLPTQKTAQVRSIQKHDDDAEFAYTGDRVGLNEKYREQDRIEHIAKCQRDYPQTRELKNKGNHGNHEY